MVEQSIIDEISKTYKKKGTAIILHDFIGIGLLLRVPGYSCFADCPGSSRHT